MFEVPNRSHPLLQPELIEIKKTSQLFLKMYFFLALVLLYFICHVSTQEDSHSFHIISFSKIDFLIIVIIIIVGSIIFTNLSGNFWYQNQLNNMNHN